MKIHIFLGRAKQFYFRIKARNGQIIAASEGYASKQNALLAIRSIQKNAPSAKIIDEINGGK